MLKKMPISYRLMLFVPILLLSLVTIVWFGLSELRSRLIDDRRDSLKSLVEVAHHVVDGWYQKEKSGALSREQAQASAREELWGLRYGDNTYFFVQGFDGTTWVHIQREFEGKNRITATDVDGTPTVRNQIEAAKSGGGYVYYRTAREGTLDKNSRMLKLSYVVPFAPWQWAVGTGIYIEDVDAIYAASMRLYLGLGAALLLLASALAVAIARSISKPLSIITERMGQLADGDLSIEVPFLGEGHEVGRLARALDIFKVNRRRADELAAVQQAEQAAKLHRQERVEQTIASFQERAARVVEAVMGSAESVQAHSGRLTEMAQHSGVRIGAVNHAADNTTGNVQTIASAAEELSAAVGEVNRQITYSTDVAERAVAEADRTNMTMRSLSDASQRIGAIVQTIQEIASQTNLLALNATIEAARAGEAGKGFAVVASEVKLLANQTTKATEEIQQQVDGVQAETNRAVEAIASIGKTVADMRTVSTGIASAMEEQGATCREIARNIGQAASSTKEVSSNIAGVADAADATSQAATGLHTASEDLRREAAVLNQEIAAFFGELRAA